MRKLMMVAAAAAIALVGLSANTCGGGDQKPPEQPRRPSPRRRPRHRLRRPRAIARNAARALI